MMDRVWKILPNASNKLALVSMPGRGPWTGGRTSLVDLVSHRILRDLYHPDAPMVSLAWVGNYQIVGGHEGLILVYEEDSLPIAMLTGLESEVRQILVTQKAIVAVGEDGKCVRWPVNQITELAK
jgi:hypothetical protein